MKKKDLTTELTEAYIKRPDVIKLLGSGGRSLTKSYKK